MMASLKKLSILALCATASSIECTDSNWCHEYKDTKLRRIEKYSCYWNDKLYDAMKNACQVKCDPACTLHEQSLYLSNTLAGATNVNATVTLRTGTDYKGGEKIALSLPKGFGIDLKDGTISLLYSKDSESYLEGAFTGDITFARGHIVVSFFRSEDNAHLPAGNKIILRLTKLENPAVPMKNLNLTITTFHKVNSWENSIVWTGFEKYESEPFNITDFSAEHKSQIADDPEIQRKEGLTIKLGSGKSKMQLCERPPTLIPEQQVNWDPPKYLDAHGEVRLPCKSNYFGYVGVWCDSYSKDPHYRVFKNTCSDYDMCDRPSLDAMQGTLPRGVIYEHLPLTTPFERPLFTSEACPPYHGGGVTTECNEEGVYTITDAKCTYWCEKPTSLEQRKRLTYHENVDFGRLPQHLIGAYGPVTFDDACVGSRPGEGEVMVGCNYDGEYMILKNSCPVPGCDDVHGVPLDASSISACRCGLESEKCTKAQCDDDTIGGGPGRCPKGFNNFWSHAFRNATSYGEYQEDTHVGYEFKALKSFTIAALGRSIPLSSGDHLQSETKVIVWDVESEQNIAEALVGPASEKDEETPGFVYTLLPQAVPLEQGKLYRIAHKCGPEVLDRCTNETVPNANDYTLDYANFTYGVHSSSPLDNGTSRENAAEKNTLADDIYPSLRGELYQGVGMLTFYLQEPKQRYRFKNCFPHQDESREHALVFKLGIAIHISFLRPFARQNGEIKNEDDDDSFPDMNASYPLSKAHAREYIEFCLDYVNTILREQIGIIVKPGEWIFPDDYLGSDVPMEPFRAMEIPRYNWTCVHTPDRRGRQLRRFDEWLSTYRPESEAMFMMFTDCNMGEFVGFTMGIDDLCHSTRRGGIVRYRGPNHLVDHGAWFMFAATLAHELGHHLGLEHTFDPKRHNHGMLSETGIMSYSNSNSWKGLIQFYAGHERFLCAAIRASRKRIGASRRERLSEEDRRIVDIFPAMFPPDGEFTGFRGRRPVQQCSYHEACPEKCRKVGANGRCDYQWGCNTAVCDYDGGDCPTNQENPMCEGCVKAWIGDGVCDIQCNRDQCNMDVEDCKGTVDAFECGALESYYNIASRCKTDKEYRENCRKTCGIEEIEEPQKTIDQMWREKEAALVAVVKKEFKTSVAALKTLVRGLNAAADQRLLTIAEADIDNDDDEKEKSYFYSMRSWVDYFLSVVHQKNPNHMGATKLKAVSSELKSVAERLEDLISGEHLEPDLWRALTPPFKLVAQHLNEVGQEFTGEDHLNYAIRGLGDRLDKSADLLKKATLDFKIEHFSFAATNFTGTAKDWEEYIERQKSRNVWIRKEVIHMAERLKGPIKALLNVRGCEDAARQLETVNKYFLVGKIGKTVAKRLIKASYVLKTAARHVDDPVGEEVRRNAGTLKAALPDDDAFHSREELEKRIKMILIASSHKSFQLVKIAIKLEEVGGDFEVHLVEKGISDLAEAVEHLEAFWEIEKSRMNLLDRTKTLMKYIEGIKILEEERKNLKRKEIKWQKELEAAHQARLREEQNTNAQKLGRGVNHELWYAENNTGGRLLRGLRGEMKRK